MFNSETEQHSDSLIERLPSVFRGGQYLLCMGKSGLGKHRRVSDLASSCAGVCVISSSLLPNTSVRAAVPSLRASVPYLCPISASLLSCSTAPGAPAPALTDVLR